DHDGNYLETLYPWNPDKLDRVDIPKRTLPDAKIWRDRAPPADSRVVPVLDGYGTARPFGVVQDYTCLAVAAGKMCMYTKGGFFDRRRLLRLRTDGTTGGEALEGATFNGDAKNRSFAGQGHIALSPDARWVYVSGMACSPGVGNKRGVEPPPYAWNAVYRFAWDAQGAVCDDQDSFLGEVSRDIKKAGADTDNAHFNAPQGLACDSQGRLYVADHGNNRVQVFSPDGKYVKTIPVKDPQEIAVHPKTGEIYILCFQKLSAGIPKTASLTLVKFGPLPEAVERFRQSFVAEGDIYADQRNLTPVMALDGWAAEPRVWLVHKQGVVRIYADKGKEFQLLRDFHDEVHAAGFTPHFTGDAGMGMIVADPLRGHVYRGSAHCQPFARLDPEEGKSWQIMDTSGIRTPSRWRGGLEELCFSWSGLLHVRHLQYVARFNPDKFKPKPVLGLDSEVPFDYGEELQPPNRQGGETAVLLRGVVTIPWAMGGANGYNNGFTVSPRGDILANVENYQTTEAFTKYGKFDGSLLNALKKDLEDRYRPALFPGRIWGGSQLIFRWDARGQASAVDIVPGVAVESQGIRTDRDGNLYIGLQYHQSVNGRPHIGGSLAKFAPKGARLIAGAGTPVPLEEAPNRPPDFHNKVWAKNMFWSLPGLDQIYFVDDVGTNYPCPCYHCKFDTDPYGRCFVPRAYGYHVAVVDTNGNRICEIGRYGNADRPAMKPGDTDIGLGNCSFVATVSDKWLYINDEPNLRIIRVKLGYHTEKRVALGGP
ncbi:MAG: SMP-30/gluconolactonase/LRE family protein, partial [Planctomycetia bacterium]|nr:SMP-30/gluconolactonase/LRE family protein [Planctomycetia bacterium]